jgi:competence ComEA-like helix-hairpin-helix protein
MQALQAAYLRAYKAHGTVWAQLISEPGIGPSTAQAIVDVRTKKGAFSKIEELIEIKGIGTKKLATLSEYLVVVPSTPPPTSSTGTTR